MMPISTSIMLLKICPLWAVLFEIMTLPRTILSKKEEKSIVCCFFFPQGFSSAYPYHPVCKLIANTNLQHFIFTLHVVLRSNFPGTYVWPFPYMSYSVIITKEVKSLNSGNLISVLIVYLCVVRNDDCFLKCQHPLSCVKVLQACNLTVCGDCNCATDCHVNGSLLTGHNKSFVMQKMLWKAKRRYWGGFTSAEKWMNYT